MKIACVIILLALMGINLGLNLGKHGEPKDEKYNFWGCLIATGIQVLLFWGAGLFDCFSK